MTVIISLIFILLSCLSILRSPSNIFLVIVIDSMIVNRFYSSFLGIPFVYILLGTLVMSYILNNQSIKVRFHSIFLHITLVSIYFFISNYSYFQTFDTTILNNLILTFVLYSSISHSSLKRIWILICKIFVIMGLLLSTEIILPIEIFGNHNQVGFFILFSIIFCLSGRYISKSFLFNNIVLAFLCLIIVLSLGRLNTAILAITLIIYTFMLNLNSSHKVFRIFLIAFPALFLLIQFSSNILGFFDFDQLNLSSISFSSLSDGSLKVFTQGRDIIYLNLIEQFKDNKIFGLGFGSFKDINNSYNISYYILNRDVAISSHSIYLQYLAETGLIGFSLYFLFLLRCFFISRKLIIEKNNFVLSYGITLLLISLILILGGSLDNHGIFYRQIFLIIALLPYIQDLKLETQIENSINN